MQIDFLLPEIISTWVTPHQIHEKKADQHRSFGLVTPLVRPAWWPGVKLFMFYPRNPGNIIFLPGCPTGKTGDRGDRTVLCVKVIWGISAPYKWCFIYTYIYMLGS